MVVVKEKKNLKRSDDADLCFCRQISVLKAKLNEALSMPAGKQKLQYEVSATCLVDVLHVASVHVFVSSFVAHMFAVSTPLSHLLLPTCSLYPHLCPIFCCPHVRCIHTFVSSFVAQMFAVGHACVCFFLLSRDPHHSVRLVGCSNPVAFCCPHTVMCLSHFFHPSRLPFLSTFLCHCVSFTLDCVDFVLLLSYPPCCTSRSPFTACV